MDQTCPVSCAIYNPPPLLFLPRYRSSHSELAIVFRHRKRRPSLWLLYPEPGRLRSSSHFRIDTSRRRLFVLDGVFFFFFFLMILNSTPHFVGFGRGCHCYRNPSADETALGEIRGSSIQAFLFHFLHLVWGIVSFPAVFLQMQMGSIYRRMPPGRLTV